MVTVSYHVESLGSVANGFLAAVNNQGVAVGSQTVPQHRGILLDGPTLTEIHPPGASRSRATDINDAGQVVGSFFSAVDGGNYGFFRGSDGSYVTLTGPEPGIIHERLRINNQGVVAGTWSDRAVRWEPLSAGGATAMPLGDAGLSNVQFSQALDVDDTGQIVGAIHPGAGDSHAAVAVWKGGTWTIVPGLEALEVVLSVRLAGNGGTLAGVATRIVGSSVRFELFAYANGSLQFLDPPSAAVDGIDVTAHGGRLVGTVPPGPGTIIPFRFNAQKGFVDLNTLIAPNLGWTLLTATAISNNGTHIVGQGELSGAQHLYRLTEEIVPGQVDPPAPPIPHEWAVRVLAGAAGGTGVGLGPRGEPIPIPPRTGDRIALTEGMTEVLATLAAHELARYSADPETRRSLQPALLRAAMARLESMAKRAARGPKDDGKNR